MKKVYLVYQDCPLCGDKGEVRKVEIADVAKHGIEVEKVSFASPLGQKFCADVILEHKAKGVGLPFYTDGEKFTMNVMDFIETPIKEYKVQKAQTQRKRKTSKKAR